MEYNYKKDYTSKIYDGYKGEQELLIVTTIMELLNKHTYDDLDEFKEKNKTYQDFLTKNNLTTAVKHFGNSLKETDYEKIFEDLKKIEKKKKIFETKDIKTTDINENQYVAYKGEIVDNSNNDRTIEEQMKYMQPTNEEFQTVDTEKNTDNMFRDLKENKNETITQTYLNEVVFDNLTEEEKELFYAAQEYEETIDGKVKVDLKKGVMIDPENNIMKLVNDNGEIKIFKNENGEEKEVSRKNSIQKTYVMQPSTDTLYSN